ncbi:MAG TPA: zinc-binding dehydrogenase [Ramlibacter sp.]|nr:zinc-binding dehydrogenase [Ramlibacter sp.]
MVLDENSTAGISLGTRQLPALREDHVQVRVKAISLNPGELRHRTKGAPPGWYPGRDFAGIVERAAANGGPPVGTRIVGWVNGGAFAETVQAPVTQVAPLPSEVSWEDAASLPVAGLTSFLALERAGLLLARRVLVTGGTGGVGHFGIQLAHAAGAHVTATVRSEKSVQFARAMGAETILRPQELADLPGCFDFVLETTGIHMIPAAVKGLVAGGTCVAVSRSLSPAENPQFDLLSYLARGQSLQSLYVFDELAKRNSGADLSRLAQLVAVGRLRPHIGLRASWTTIEDASKALLERRVLGKVVLTLDE